MAGPRRSGLILVLLILAGVLVLEATVRFASGYELGRVLFIEATLFMFAAALLNSIARRADLSGRARTAIRVLSVAFVLGAIRSALWFAGLEVHWANLVILVIGLALFTMWWRRRGRS
ncbi:MAG TPA: hypothetical protein VMO47_06635 [Rhodothermales bacterium]|nr:hypothetical protein [Rhodothermales bacterium]